MKLRSSLVVIICCLIVQLINLAQLNFILIGTDANVRIATFTVQGLTYLCYPLLGYLADVYLTRYRALKCGLVILTGSSLYLTMYAFANTIANNVFHSRILQDRVDFLIVPGFSLLIVGIGLFEANAIQFGLDQLLEAPTSKLISFIHWYYWAQNVGQLIIFYTVASIMTIESEFSSRDILNIAETALLALVTSAISATVVLYCASKKNFYIEGTGLNPFKNVCKVLKYSWKHKVPEHRSAFTYWEEDIPRRIDLGKNKYGGPFTNEEVENVKTFLRILPLLLYLFGYHLAGDGISALIQLQRTSCPSLPVLLLLGNPQHLPALVTVVGIPLYRLVVNIWSKQMQMLTKMWVGLYLSLLQIVLYIIVVVNHDTSHWPQHSHIPGTILFHNKTCFDIRTSHLLNQTEYLINQPVDNTYLWFIIPQLLNGLSSLLVSMTVFEFICAQAPRTTQGLLIGLWYATFSIRYLVVDVMNFVVIERRSWLIYEGVKGFLILVSLVLFYCVSKRYRHRQRDEIVNVQGMIEEIYERQLAHHQEYLAEQENELLKNATSNYNSFPEIK